MLFTIEELISGCKKSDRKAQLHLYTKYRGIMMSLVCRYIDCPFISEEVMNDGFVRIFQKIDLFESKGSFEGWMKKLMSHAVADAVKTDDRIISKERKGFGRRVDSAENNLPNEMKVKWQDRLGHDELILAVNRLPSTTCKAFKLYLQGYKHMEIGKLLGISEGTSKWHINEARKLLKPLINK